MKATATATVTVLDGYCRWECQARDEQGCSEAERKGLGPVRGLDDDGGTALDSGLALSFLLPQMGERPAVAAEAEYDDVEAREADADEVRGPWIRTP